MGGIFLAFNPDGDLYFGNKSLHFICIELNDFVVPGT